MSDYELKLPLEVHDLCVTQPVPEAWLSDALQRTVALPPRTGSHTRKVSELTQLAHAANCHNELVGAMRSALDDITKSPACETQRMALKTLRAALAKADKGGGG